MKQTFGFFFLFIISVLFIYACMITPLSLEHGYYVTVAKFLSTGALPWKDINLMDTPVGFYILSIPYSVIRNASNGILAQWIVTGFHFLNLFLLYILLKRNGNKGVTIFWSLCIYVLTALSYCGMNVNLEPFANTFILLSLLCLGSDKKKNIVIGGICFALAVGCKIQILTLIPALLLYLILSRKIDKVQGKILLTSIFSSLLVLYLFFVCLSGQPVWYKNLDISIHHSGFSLYTFIVNVCLISIKSGFFIIIPFVFLLRNQKKLFKTVLYPILACYIGILCLLTIGYDKSWGQLCIPFIIIGYCSLIQNFNNRKLAPVLLTLGLAIPTTFATRELIKLDFGKEKEGQKEVLERIYKSIQYTEGIHVINYKTPEYGIGAQIFSEKNLVPYNIDKTRYGFVDWKNPIRVAKEAQEAPILVIPSVIYFGLGTFRKEFNHEPWVEEFSQYLVQTQATGNLSYTILYKNGIPEELYQETLRDAHFETDEEHHHHNHDGHDH